MAKKKCTNDPNGNADGWARDERNVMLDKIGLTDARPHCADGMLDKMGLTDARPHCADEKVLVEDESRATIHITAKQTSQNIGSNNSTIFYTLYMAFLCILVLVPAVESSCDKSIAVQINVEFFQQSLTRAASSEKVIRSSRKFTSVYNEYYKSISKSTSAASSHASSDAQAGDRSSAQTEARSDSGSQQKHDSLDVSYSAGGSFAGFGAEVSAAVSKVASSSSTFANSRYSSGSFSESDSTSTSNENSEQTATSGTQINSGTRDDEDESEVFEHTEISIEQEYHDGFLQIIRITAYTVTIDGTTARLEEKRIVNSVPIASPWSYATLISKGDEYISRSYGEAGGEISRNTFSQRKCYKTLTEEEQDQLSFLEKKMADLENRNTAQNAAQNTTQNTKISILEEKIADLENTIGVLENTTTAQNTAQNTAISTLEGKQTRIIKSPTGSLRSASCLVTCVGSTGEGTTSWRGSSGRVYTAVSMSGCGFIYTPIITASVEGNSYTDYMTQSVTSATTTQFYVWMYGWVFTSYHPNGYSSTKPSTSHATRGKWTVNWHATGYVC